MNPQPTDHIVGVSNMVSTDTMREAFEKFKAERDQALAASRWETDLCEQALSDLKLITEERDSLKAELAALRAQPVQPAARVPMTEDQIINLVIKCEKDWNKCAAESNQWKYLYWEEYAVVICRAIEAFHKIEIRS